MANFYKVSKLKIDTIIQKFKTTKDKNEKQNYRQSPIR